MSIPFSNTLVLKGCIKLKQQYRTVSQLQKLLINLAICNKKTLFVSDMLELFSLFLPFDLFKILCTEDAQDSLQSALICVVTSRGGPKTHVKPKEKRERKKQHHATNMEGQKGSCWHQYQLTHVLIM